MSASPESERREIASCGCSKPSVLLHVLFLMPRACRRGGSGRGGVRVDVAKAAIAGDDIRHALFDRAVLAVPVYFAIDYAYDGAPWGIPKSAAGWNIKTK